jgi:hypothetical protein
MEELQPFAERLLQHPFRALAEREFIERNHFFIIFEFFQQGLDRHPLDRVNVVGSDFAQRLEDEAPFMKAGMRDQQRPSPDDLVVEEKQVEIDGSRRPAMFPLSSQQDLDLLGHAKKLNGIQIGSDFQSAIGVPVLLFAAERQGLRLIKVRDADHLDKRMIFHQADGLADVFQLVAQIASDSNECDVFHVFFILSST